MSFENELHFCVKRLKNNQIFISPKSVCHLYFKVHFKKSKAALIF